MTKKDYIQFARILKYAHECKTDSTNEPVYDYPTVSYLTHQFALLFADDNPNFDREKFYRAVFG